MPHDAAATPAKLPAPPSLPRECRATVMPPARAAALAALSFISLGAPDSLGATDIRTASTLPAPTFIACQCTCCDTAYTPAEWPLLAYVGRQDDGRGGWLELRNCVCGSTIAVELEPELTR